MTLSTLTPMILRQRAFPVTALALVTAASLAAVAAQPQAHCGCDARRHHAGTASRRAAG